MKKTLLRIVAVLAAVIMLSAAFAGCLPMGAGQEQPSVDRKPDAALAEKTERVLVFKKNVASLQVNTRTAIGYFCYEDEPLRILTETSGDDSVALDVKLYDGDKKEDGSNLVSKDKYECRIASNGLLLIESPVIGTLEITASTQKSAPVETVEMSVSRQSLSIWDIIMLAIGLYLGFAAVSGKGKLYENEFVREGMEKRHKLIIRLTCAIVGLLMLATGVITIFDAYGSFRIVKAVLFGVILVVFIAALVLIRVCTDQDAKRESQRKQAEGRTLKAPSSAFEFDESEPTLDDIKN